jgi:hypothetical protein
MPAAHVAGIGGPPRLWNRLPRRFVLGLASGPCLQDGRRAFVWRLLRWPGVLCRTLSRRPVGPVCGQVLSHWQGALEFALSLLPLQHSLVCSRAVCRAIWWRHVMRMPALALGRVTSRRRDRLALAVSQVGLQWQCLELEHALAHTHVLPAPILVTAQVSNASGSAVAAIPATPMGSMPEISLAGAGSAFVANNDPWFVRLNSGGFGGLSSPNQSSSASA